MQKKLTLYQLVQLVSEWFRQLFDEFEFWAEVEIAAIKPYKSRLYCEFIQADESWWIVAKATGILRDPSIMQKFLKASGLKRSELVWTMVLVRGVCSFHQKYGWSITVRELNAEYTRGKQLTHREKVIEQLKKERVWKKNQRLRLPIKPLRCAVITWHGSAGYEDFRTVLTHSWYAIDLIPYRSIVEWNKAIQEVNQAFEKILNATENYDCIIIARWWWAKDWFLWQDDYMLWKKIGMCQIPVIVAVWHTRDQTLLDQTVYYSAKTPTDAAYHLIEHLQYVYSEIEKTYQDISVAIPAYYDTNRTEIENQFELIRALCDSLLIHKFQTIEEVMQDIKWYDPKTQLEKWRWLITTTEWKIQRSDLRNDVFYSLHHWDKTYTITIH